MVIDSNTQFQTLEDFYKVFTSEEVAYAYFNKIRWGGFPTCPSCGKSGCYVCSPMKFKCSNKICKTEFNVKVRSVMHGTKLSLIDWALSIFLRIKRTGFGVTSIMTSLDILEKAAIRMAETLDTIVDQEERQGQDLKIYFNHCCKKLFVQSKLPKTTKGGLHIGAFFKFENITDIGDEKTYNRLCFYARKLLWYQLTHKWIFYEFATPEECVAEMFLTLHEQKIYRYDIKIVDKYLKYTISRMWKDHLKEQKPHIIDYYRNYAKRKKTEYRRTMHRYYLTELLIRQKEYKNNFLRSELKKDFELMERKRAELKEVRLKRKSTDLSEFISHFD